MVVSMDGGQQAETPLGVEIFSWFCAHTRGDCCTIVDQSKAWLLGDMGLKL